jgi:hypothetical protein
MVALNKLGLQSSNSQEIRGQANGRLVRVAKRGKVLAFLDHGLE